MNNPYEAHPSLIPPEDRYGDMPLYGRYHPKKSDFRPDPKYFSTTNSNDISQECLLYWDSVLKQCDKFIRIYESTESGRDVFALGSVIVKSSHLKHSLKGRRVERNYLYADANEVKSVQLAGKLLKKSGMNVKVPQIYFSGVVSERNVLIQERIPGVGLNIAWQYISQSQKDSFKKQARGILQCLHSFQSPTPSHPSYLVPDPDPVRHRGIQELEKELLFGRSKVDYMSDSGNNKTNMTDLSFTHNDLSLSNCIVDKDRIIGLVDWEMAGFFGWEAAAAVHVQIRMPKKENFAAIKNLSKEKLDDILFWNDLYVSRN